MTVVVRPGDRHRLAQGDRQTVLLATPVQQCLVPQKHPARATAGTAEAAQDGDKIVVAQSLQLADGAVARLGVGLAADGFDKRRIQLGHIGQLGPGPVEGRAELRDVALHSCLAAGNPVGLEEPHLRPAEAETHADRVIDLGGGCDAVLQHPQCLAPDRLLEAVADEGVDLLTQNQRVHADRGNHLGGLVAKCRIARNFRQRQQVDRVERMHHHHRRAAGGEVAGLEARGRGRDEITLAQRRGDLVIHPVLQLEPLRDALLHPVRARHRFGDRGGKGEAALGRQRAGIERGQRGAGIVQHLADLAVRLGVGVEDCDVPAVEQEARGPATADDAPADDRGAAHAGAAGAARFTRPSCARTSSGPISEAPMLLSRLAAFSTSCALVASTPRSR